MDMAALKNTVKGTYSMRYFAVLRITVVEM